VSEWGAGVFAWVPKKIEVLFSPWSTKACKNVIEVLFSTQSAKKASLMQEFDPSSGFLIHQY
jgi:hypothetical protein